jgi:hypothetical protein
MKGGRLPVTKPIVKPVFGLCFSGVSAEPSDVGSVSNGATVAWAVLTTDDGADDVWAAGTVDDDVDDVDDPHATATNARDTTHAAKTKERRKDTLSPLISSKVDRSDRPLPFPRVEASTCRRASQYVLRNPLASRADAVI